MPRNPTLFTITVPITKKMMDGAIGASTYELEDYDAKHYKAAGLSVKKLRAELANDERFRKELTRQMIGTSKQAIMDAFDYSDISVSEHPTIKAAIKQLDQAVEAEEKQTQRDREAERIKDATKLLTSAGFRVVRG